jgi:hypothetical protein
MQGADRGATDYEAFDVSALGICTSGELTPWLAAHLAGSVRISCETPPSGRMRTTTQSPTRIGKLAMI